VNPDEITFFKSVGVAVQDAMAARLVVRNGSAMGLGAMAQL
jgi:ornithine cyclodeaminase/alanine dehydrogenase-like protein (mu-crystallin family)